MCILVCFLWGAPHGLLDSRVGLGHASLELKAHDLDNDDKEGTQQDIEGMKEESCHTTSTMCRTLTVE